jgi:hypothetical protein
MKNILMSISLAFLMSACSTLKVDVDYDSSYNFTDKIKYAIVHNSKEGDNTLVNDRIQKAIETQLDAKNYEEVAKDKADLVFVFHVNVMQRSDIRSDYEMIGYRSYGYGGAWGYRGFGGYSRTPVLVEKPSLYRWKEGRLVIDALNTKSKKIVWRGIVKDELSDGSSSAEEKTKYINSVVGKLFKKFPKD